MGFPDTRSVNIPGVDEIESVTVNLNFTGGWNGDLYAHLVHGSGFLVLFNRPDIVVVSAMIPQIRFRVGQPGNLHAQMTERAKPFAIRQF